MYGTLKLRGRMEYLVHHNMKSELAQRLNKGADLNGIKMKLITGAEQQKHE